MNVSVMPRARLGALLSLALVAPALAHAHVPVPLREALPGPRLTATVPVKVGDTFNYAYTTSLNEKIGKVPFKRFFKGLSTTTIESFSQEVSGHAIQFAFFAQGGDIGNQNLTDTLVNFSGSGSALHEQVWGYTESSDPTDSFITASPGFSTPYIVDVLPEQTGSSWRTGGANLSEYTNQSFGRDVFYEDGFTKTQDTGETERDDILFDASAGHTTGTNTSDAADGTGVTLTVPANEAAQVTSFALPVASGSHFVIPVTTNGKTVNVPDWYPGGGQPPHPIVSDAFAITAPVSTPKDCGKMGGINADDVHEMVSVLSVTRGMLAQRDSHFYDTPAGTICRVEQISITGYNNTSDGQINSTINVKTVVRLVTGSLLARVRSGSGTAFRSDFTSQDFVQQVSYGPKFLF